jgi:5-methylcytosine-specific restriction endonuclease McrA
MMKSKRSKACDITNKIRKEVLERDNFTCVNCGRHNMLTIAHVYVSRAFGGKGIPTNLAVLCTVCHGHLDNGKAHESMIVKFNVERYMERIYGKPNLDEITFRKWG